MMRIREGDKLSDYPERKCPVCGSMFKPTKASQVYDKAYCRTVASRQRRKVDIPEIEQNKMLMEMRIRDPEIADDIERVAKLVGIQVAEEVLTICWRAMNRAARRLNHEERIMAENRLIEAGKLAPKKKRSKPTSSEN